MGMNELKFSLTVMKILLAVIYGSVIGAIIGYLGSIFSISNIFVGIICGAIAGVATVLIFGKK